MSTEARSIITNAEYLAIFTNGRNNHKVRNILAKIYLMCGLGKMENAKTLVDELYRVLHQVNSSQPKS